MKTSRSLMAVSDLRELDVAVDIAFITSSCAALYACAAVKGCSLFPVLLIASPCVPVHHGRTMKIVIFCLLVASAMTCSGQMTRAELLRQNQTQAKLSPTFVTVSWRSLAVTMAFSEKSVMVNSNAVRDAADAATIAAKTIGERVVAIALWKYANEATVRDALDRHPEAAGGALTLHLANFGHCRDAITRIVDDQTGKAEIPECNVLDTPDTAISAAVAEFSKPNPEIGGGNRPRLFIPDQVSTTGTSTANDYGIFGTVVKSSNTSVNYANAIMGEFGKSCSDILLTTDPATATLALSSQTGASTLTSKSGDVLYVSPAKTLKNMVKDVCAYLHSH